MKDTTIFHEYYETKKFQDRFQRDESQAVDVVIPLINTTILWRQNLLAYYREIPVHRLIIGDGGCTDNSIEIAREFPRVEIVDQRTYKSLGYCIKKLIEAVSTEHFIYLHADVYLPPGWFDSMYRYRNEYDWFECNRRMTVLFDYEEKMQNLAERAYSGSQFGRTEAFKKILSRVEDDYLQRNEDIIFMELIRESDGGYFRNPDTFHYHQIMNKRGELEPNIRSVVIERESDREWESRILDMQVRGIIKYLRPKGYLIDAVNIPLRVLNRIERVDWKVFKSWVAKTNPVWLGYLRNPNRIGIRIVDMIVRVGKRLVK
jgi:hypothetical protein